MHPSVSNLSFGNELSGDLAVFLRLLSVLTLSTGFLLLWTDLAVPLLDALVQFRMRSELIH